MRRYADTSPADVRGQITAGVQTGKSRVREKEPLGVSQLRWVVVDDFATQEEPVP